MQRILLHIIAYFDASGRAFATAAAFDPPPLSLMLYEKLPNPKYLAFYLKNANKEPKYSKLFVLRAYTSGITSIFEIIFRILPPVFSIDPRIPIYASLLRYSYPIDPTAAVPILENLACRKYVLRLPQGNYCIG